MLSYSHDKQHPLINLDMQEWIIYFATQNYRNDFYALSNEHLYYRIELIENSSTHDFRIISVVYVAKT